MEKYCFLEFFFFFSHPSYLKLYGIIILLDAGDQRWVIAAILIEYSYKFIHNIVSSLYPQEVGYESHITDEDLGVKEGTWCFQGQIVNK